MIPAKSVAGIAAAVAALLVAGAAQAHAHLVKADPAKDAAVTAPARIHLEFSEKLEPKFSTASLMTLAGAPVASTATVAGKTIEATPKATLKPGAYMVMWKVVSSDGHKISGDYNFTVK